MSAAVVCASGVELITEYLEGALPPDVRSRLESHVAGCERCTAFVRSFRETPRILRQATAAAVPTGLAESLTEFLRRHRGRG
jgi:anti-sigma factor RsiW